MTKRSTLLFITALLLSVSSFAQNEYNWVTTDTQIPTGTYGTIGTANATITIPAGQVVTASELNSGGNLIVEGELILTDASKKLNLYGPNNNTFIIRPGAKVTCYGLSDIVATTQIDGDLDAKNGNIDVHNNVTIGQSASLTTTGIFTQQGNIVFDENSIVSVGEFKPNAIAPGIIEFKSGASFTTLTTDITAGSLHVDANATFKSGDLKLSNPNNIIEGTLIVTGTLIFANAPNTINCPGKIIAENLTNASGVAPINGTGYIEVHQAFNSPNEFTNSNGIHLNLQGTTSGNTGAATLDATNPCAPLTLPVSVKSLQAVLSNNSVAISWITTTEINSQSFDIEHSTDGIHYTKIGSKTSQALNGNSTVEIHYSFTDPSPKQGINYYRLKQVDLMGHISFSDKTISISTSQTDHLKIYPNPARTTLHITGVTLQNAVYVIFDATGRQVIKSKAPSISLTGIPGGIYFIQMMHNNKSTFIGKFIKN